MYPFFWGPFGYVCIVVVGDTTTVRKCDLLLVRLSVIFEVYVYTRYLERWSFQQCHTYLKTYTKKILIFFSVFVSFSILYQRLQSFFFCFFCKKKFMVCLASFGNFVDFGMILLEFFTQFIFGKCIIKLYDIHYEPKISERIICILHGLKWFYFSLFPETCKGTTFQWYLKWIFSICRSWGYCKYNFYFQTSCLAILFSWFSSYIPFGYEFRCGSFKYYECHTLNLWYRVTFYLVYDYGDNKCYNVTLSLVKTSKIMLQHLKFLIASSIADRPN